MLAALWTQRDETARLAMLQLIGPKNAAGANGEWLEEIVQLGYAVADTFEAYRERRHEQERERLAQD